MNDARSAVAIGEIAWFDTGMPLDARSGIVRRSQIGELGKQIGVGPYFVPVTFPFVKTATKASPASSVSVRPLLGKDAGRVGS